MITFQLAVLNDPIRPRRESIWVMMYSSIDTVRGPRTYRIPLRQADEVAGPGFISGQHALNCDPSASNSIRRIDQDPYGGEALLDDGNYVHTRNYVHAQAKVVDAEQASNMNASPLQRIDNAPNRRRINQDPYGGDGFLMDRKEVQSAGLPDQTAHDDCAAPVGFCGAVVADIEAVGPIEDVAVESDAAGLSGEFPRAVQRLRQVEGHLGNQLWLANVKIRGPAQEDLLARLLSKIEEKTF